MTGLEKKRGEIESWLHESAIWTSDVDFWLDETRSYQGLLDKAVKSIHDKARLKTLDHLQNIVNYYGKEVLIDLKSRVFHHREHLTSSTNGSLEKMYEGVSTEHEEIQAKVSDIEKRMREYKSEFKELKVTLDALDQIAYVPLQHILIPTDFSDNADRAVDYALSILGKGARKITLLHVFFSASSSVSGLNSDEQIAEKLSRVRFDNEIARIQRGFPDLADKVETAFRIGNLNHWVENLLDTEKVDLLIMGTRGAGEGTLLFGSNTSAIVQKVKTPVFVIPDEAPLLPPKRIMFATDLEVSESPKGIEILKCIAEQYSTELHLVHVDPVNKAIDSIHERIKTKDSLQALGLQGSRLEYIESDDVLAGINEYVKENLIDVAVTVTHHEGFLRTLFAPSTTKQLVLHSHIPILVLHDNSQD